MLNIYKYVFYRTYIWQDKAFGATNSPAFTAMLLVSALVYCNVLEIGLLVRALGGIDVYPHLSKGLVLIIGGTIAVVNYLFFLYRNKSETIVHDFNKETSRQRFLRGSLMWLFVIGSIGLFLFLAQ